MKQGCVSCLPAIREPNLHAQMILLFVSRNFTGVQEHLMRISFCAACPDLNPADAVVTSYTFKLSRSYHQQPVASGGVNLKQKTTCASVPQAGCFGLGTVSLDAAYIV